MKQKELELKKQHLLNSSKAVSYTHLDVYKGQSLCCAKGSVESELTGYISLELKIAKDFGCIFSVNFLRFFTKSELEICSYLVVITKDF